MWRRVLPIIALTAVYFFVGKLGLRFASLNPSASAIWPPTGIALASAIILGYRVWPALLIGAFLVNITTAGTIGTSLGIGIGNMLEGVVGAYLVNRFAHGIHAFEKPRDVAMFAFVAAAASTMISATIGVTTLASAGFAPWNTYWSVWLTWWLGDMGGALIVAPAILLWFTNPRIVWGNRKALELALIAFFLLFLGFLIFSGIFPFPYIVIPAFVWLAFRFSPRQVSSALFFLSILAILATMSGLGPFILHSKTVNGALIQLQLFLTVMSLSQLIIAAEVKERKRAQTRFRALIEKSTDGISLVDTMGKVLYASPSVAKILGYTPEELVGKSGFPLVHPEDLPHVQKLLATVIATPNASDTSEIRVQRKNGTWVWIESTTRNLLSDPAVHALVSNFRDISERKELERAKDEFLMIAAHELRSPLSSMRWNMESLLKDAAKFPKSFKEKVHQIYHNNHKMITLVNEILDVSRIIQGKVTDSPQRTDVAALILKEMKDIEPVAKKFTIAITLEPLTKIPTIMIDPQKLSAVIHNILANAVTYNTSGGWVTVSAQAKDRMLHLRIADGGIGIPISEQKKLFSKFFRASNAVARQSEGTGLGLFIVQSYVRGWGGSVRIESPTVDGNHGTTVHVTIPI